MCTAFFTILFFGLAKMFGVESVARSESNLVQGIAFLGAGGILREAGGLVGWPTAATIFVEAAIGMAVGGGLYAVGGYATGLVLFGLVVLGWIAQRSNLKVRIMGFRITGSHAENIAGEVQRLVAELKIKPQKVRVSMVGEKSVEAVQAEV